MSNLYDKWQETVPTVYDSEELSTLELVKSIYEFNSDIAKSMDNFLSLQSDIEINEEDRNNKEYTRIENETTRLGEETKRKSSENTRVNSEINREKEEIKRQTNENSRNNTEIDRIRYEDKRELNESIRKSYEEDRKTNEVERKTNENERKLRETERNTNENVRKTNENSRVNKETERLASEVIRVNNEIKRQTVYSEIEKSRNDFNNKSHDNLSERLNSDMSYISDRFNKASLLEYEGKYISAENSFDGLTKDLKIKGRTLQNLSPNFNKDSWIVGGSSPSMSITRTNRKISVVKTTTGSMLLSNNDFSSIFTKGGTYTALFKITSTINHSEMAFRVRYEDGIYYKICDIKTTGDIICKFTLDSIKDIKHLNFGYIGSFADNGILTIEDLIILEGDYTDKTIPGYFEGIQSVGEESNKVEVLSCGKNLWKPIIDSKFAEINYIKSEYINGTLTLIGSGDGTKEGSNLMYYIRNKVLPNTNYYFSYESDGIYGSVVGQDTIEAFILNENITYAHFNIPPNGITFNSGNNNVIYFRFDINKNNTTHKFYNFMLQDITYKTPYEAYKEDKIIIPLTEPLRSIPNGVDDEVDLENGKLIRRIGKVVFDGSENWVEKNFPFASKIYAYKIKESNLYGKHISICLTNTVPYIKYSETQPNHKSVYIVEFPSGLEHEIRFQNGNCNNVSELKAWLKANPTTVYYELLTPIETPIDVPNSIRTYDNKTHIFTQESLIAPTLKAKIPSDVNAIISTLKLENQELINEMEENNILNIENSLDQDLRITKIELGVI